MARTTSEITTGAPPGMNRVAVFGNAGGGKSTLARELAAITGLPLAVVDELQYRAGGEKVPHEEYVRAHAAWLARDQWIIDGFGGIPLLWERLEAADTLVHVDLPLAVHAWWVTKRLLKGLFRAPAGWPEGSPVISSSIASYRVLWPCHARLTPRYRTYVAEAAPRKRVFHLRSRAELTRFLASMRQAHAPPRAESARPPAAAPARDLTVPVLIAVLGALEILVLAALFFLETPLSPHARRASESVGGTLALVGAILSVLCMGTAVFWALFNRYRRRSRARAAEREP